MELSHRASRTGVIYRADSRERSAQDAPTVRELLFIIEQIHASGQRKMR